MILPYTGSYHYPVQLTIQPDEPLKGNPFKFDNMWLRDDRMLDLIATWWDEIKIGNHSHLFKINKKLNFVKQIEGMEQDTFQEYFLGERKNRARFGSTK